MEDPPSCPVAGAWHLVCTAVYFGVPAANLHNQLMSFSRIALATSCVRFTQSSFLMAFVI